MTTGWSKGRLLLQLLLTNPSEFGDRVRAVLEVRGDGLRRRSASPPPLPWEQIVEGLSRTLGVDAVALDREVDASRLEPLMTEAVRRLGTNPVFTLRHNADYRFARLCYLACRALRPDVIVETGVANGVTTTFVLQALSTNDCGHLYSIDLPPLGGAGESAGRLVPDELRARWTLIRGTSRRRLPPLLDRLGPVDLFIHDSLHTFRNMTAEFAAAHRHRADRFVLLADDLEANRAFEDYLAQCGAELAFQAIGSAAAKKGRHGVAVVLSVAPRH